jgi:predicted GIY-YIG superfamily endonuclease
MFLPKRTVYVIQSIPQPRRYYIGLTSNLEKRLTAHNAGDTRSTRDYSPWQVLASIDFRDERSAIRFERYLKSGSGRAFVHRYLR